MDCCSCGCDCQFDLNEARLREYHDRLNEQQLQITRLRDTIDLLTKGIVSFVPDTSSWVGTGIRLAALQANEQLWNVT
jgi:hypothetical protein